MSQAPAPNNQRGASPEIRWDTSGIRGHACDVATATSGLDNVVLNFGATEALEGQRTAVRLMQRIGLRPRTAKNLQDMLRNLLAEYDAGGGRR